MHHTAWRDASTWAKGGLALSTGSDESARMFDAALSQFLGYYEDRETGGLGGAIQTCLQSDENCIMGHVIANAYEFMTMTCGAFDDPSKAHVGEMVNKAQAPGVTDREKKHVSAMQLLADGQFQNASLLWQEILMEHPMDILALRLAHDCCTLLGAKDQLRDIPARVLTTWEKTAGGEPLPHMSFVYSMYALGLAETNYFDEARGNAQRALELNPRDAMAHHVFALTCFYQGRLSEGVSFLRTHLEAWKPCAAFAVRNFWLLGLLLVEGGDAGEALSIYDTEIVPRILSSMVVTDCTDATNLLFRLCLEGVDLGERWRELHALGFVHRDEHVLATVDVHIMASAICTGLASEGLDLICSQKFYSRNGSGDNVGATADIGVPVSQALLSWAEGDYSTAVSTLLPIKYSLDRLGFTRLHRDVFHVFLICVGLQSPKDLHKSMVRLHLEERKRLMGKTPFTKRLDLRALTGRAESMSNGN